MTQDLALKLLKDFVRVCFRKQSGLNPDDYGLTQAWQRTLVVWLADSYHLALVIVHWPLVELGILLLFRALGPNAVESFHQFTGIWALRFLWVSLAITPLQAVTRWRGLTPFRQLFGLASFFYAALHLYGYLAIDLAWAWPLIGRDLAETVYIWPGLFSFAVLLPLALTSPKQAKKWMGRRWKKLHRWVYPASIAVVFHYVMQLKGNLADPLLYAMILTRLFAFRGGVWLKNRQLARLMIPGASRRKAAIDDPDEADLEPVAPKPRLD